MIHLTFEDYRKFGGVCGHKDFPMLLLDCESYLNLVTFESIENITELTPEIKRLEVKIIDDVLHISDERKGGVGVSSYSDGIETISYNSDEFTEKAKTEKIKKLCIKYLPVELLYRGVMDGR